MINEKMLEYLMLERTLSQIHKWNSINSDTISRMDARKRFLEDEFINEYKLPIHTIKNPLSDTIDMEK